LDPKQNNDNFKRGLAAVEIEDYEEALRLFEIAAGEGCGSAFTHLSSMFEDGIGVDVDTAKAVALLYQAADLNDAAAFNRLGYLHAVGQHVEKNLGAAVEFHKLAAQQGFANSQCDLGRHYAHGIGVQQNLAEAQKWYRLAAQAGQTLAQHNLAGLLLNNHNPHRDTAEGMQWLEAAAEAGVVKAQYEAGSLKLGNTFPELEDFQGAEFWLTNAAKNGSTEALYQIGNCFEHGVGVEQNYAIAVHNYFEALKKDNTDAAFALGTLYEHGLGVGKDLKNALKCYGIAADKFHVSALFNKGRFYQFGWAVKADYAIAHHHYLMAAERGHKMCQLLVGQALLEGVEGITVDLSGGASWVLRAAEAGLVEAQAEGGFCYLSGKGVGKDIEEALRWSRLAAEQGHAWAQYRTANILIRYGNKGEAEFEEAVKWLVLSYNQPEAEDERRHEFIKSDFEYLRSALPETVFEAACKATEVDTYVKHGSS
jgi:uncharacterized protein